MTIGEAVRSAAAVLAEAGIETPETDARALAQAAFRRDHAALLAASRDAAPEHGLASLDRLVARRAAGEPVARVLGRRAFWTLDLRLTADTLVPRPDTETVVEAALAACGPAERPLRILDLGVGSGCILLALLAERPNATGVGVDRSEGAASAARENARALGLDARASFLVGDWMAALSGPFDLVVSNPPYIPTADIAGLDVEVRRHDPSLALDGGADGLEAYAAILRDVARVLATCGVVALELGAGQAQDVARLATGSGFTVEALASDLAGVPRAMTLARLGVVIGK